MALQLAFTIAASFTQAAQALAAFQGTVAQNLAQIGSQFEQAGRRLSVGLTAPLVALGAAAVKSAKDLDSSVNTLKAFTGSAEAAEKRLAQLVATAQKTPGLTTGLALQLDAQLRVARATEESIDRILPAIGKLNAVQRIEDPSRFVQNMVQLITTDFQKRDLRELVRASPIGGQVVSELFNVDSPLNAEAIRKSAKRMGITTVDAFFKAFAEAAELNEGLSRVTESIATRFDKLVDRVQIALRPLGLAIINALTPLINVAVPIVETLGKAFGSLPAPIQTGVIAIGGLVAAIGPALFIIGSLISTVASLQRTFVALNAAGLIPTITNMRAASQAVQGTGAAAGVAAGGWLGLAAAIAAAVAVSFAITRAIDGWLATLAQGHPAFVRFASSVLGALNPLYALLRQLGLVGPETDKAAAAQSRAVAPVKDFTAAVEEESESLKQLRRELAEVELATKSRVASAQRAYTEERATFAQFTAERINALRAERDAKLALIDVDLDATRKEQETSGPAAEGLGSHGSIDKEGKTRLDKIKDLEHQRKTVIAETDIEIGNIQSEQRKKERDNEERHRESLLAVRRTEAEEQVTVLRDAAERNESLRLENEQKIVRIEQGVTEAEVREIQRRVDAASQGTEARVQLEDELAQKLAERGKQRAEQARRIAKAELEAAMLPLKREGLREGARGAGDEGVIARLRSLAEQGRVSVEASEEQIGKIVDAGLARRIKALRDEITVRAAHGHDVVEQNARLAELEQQRRNEEEANLRAIQAGREKDVENAQSYRDKLADIYQSVVETVFEARRKVIEGLSRGNLGQRRSAIEEEANLAHAEEALRHARSMGAIDDQIKLLKAKEKLNEEEVKQLKALHRAQEAEMQRNRDATAEIEGRRTDTGAKDDPFKRLKDAWDDFKDHVTNAADSIRESTARVAESVAAVFTSMEGALRQGIVAWLLYGESLGKALKAALAQSSAAVAADALIQALKHAAYAIGSWAFGDARGAILHAKAAAAFGALAVVAGLGARALASNSSGAGGYGSAGNGAGNAYSQDNQPQNRQFNYGNGFSTPSSTDTQPGSRASGSGLVGNVMAKALNEVRDAIREQNQVMGEFRAASPDSVLMKGASTNQGRRAIGTAVKEHSDEAPSFNRHLLSNLGFAR